MGDLIGAGEAVTHPPSVRDFRQILMWPIQLDTRKNPSRLRP